MTYVYADQAAVLGPLATYAEPHTYDLCHQHATRLTAPRGWEVVRLVAEYPEPQPSTDDLLALADAVREAGRPRRSQPPAAPDRRASGGVRRCGGPGIRGLRPRPDRGHQQVRRHLRMLPSATDS